MTTLNDAREAIYARFVANFTGVASTRWSFENEEFTEPDDGSWIRLTVRNLKRSQNTLGKTGNRRFRTKAMVFVQVFTEINSGVQTSDNLLKEAGDLFEGVSFSGLDFREADYHNTDASGNWKTSVVEAYFDYDEIK